MLPTLKQSNYLCLGNLAYRATRQQQCCCTHTFLPRGLPVVALMHIHVQEKTHFGVYVYLACLGDVPRSHTPSRLQMFGVCEPADSPPTACYHTLGPPRKYLSTLYGIGSSWLTPSTLKRVLRTFIYSEHTSCFLLAFQPRLPLPSPSSSSHLLQCTSK